MGKKEETERENKEEKEGRKMEGEEDDQDSTWLEIATGSNEYLKRIE